MSRNLLLALPLLALTTPAFAQEDGDSQLWTAASANTSVGDGFELGVETILRFGDDADGLYEAEFGGSLGYALSKDVKVQIGYLRVPGYSRAGTTSLENRTRVQVTANLGELAGGKLSGRLRLEQRWREGANDMGLRLRPNFKWSLPLKKGGKTAFVYWHESFIALNDTDWGQRGRYERMRNFVGVSAPLVKRVTVEAGYLNQYGFGRGPAQDSHDHVASLSLSLSL